NQLIGSGGTPQKAIAEPSAEQGGDGAGDHSHTAEDDVGAVERYVPDAGQKSRHPHLQPADSEGHHGRAQADGPVGFVAEEPQYSAALDAVRHVIAGAAYRLT